MSSTQKIVYAIAFQIGWLVCILTGNLASSCYVAIFLVVHLWQVTRQNPALLNKEIIWVAVVSVFGIVVETLAFSTGCLYLQAGDNLTARENIFEYFLLPPLWLLNLWLIFAIALRSCLSFLLCRPQLLYSLSLILIPINYYAGAALNDSVELNHPYVFSLSLITLFWLVFFWCIMHIKRRHFEDMFNAR